MQLIEGAALNPNSQNHSLHKQIKLYPSKFDMRYGNIKIKKKEIDCVLDDLRYKSVFIALPGFREGTLFIQV